MIIFLFAHFEKKFEIFDQKNMMATDEDRKVMYQRAVTGELQRAIESLEAVKEAKVMIPGFGGFAVKTRAARKGRNPSTGKEMEIPEAKVASFKVSSQLKELINVDGA